MFSKEPAPVICAAEFALNVPELLILELLLIKVSEPLSQSKIPEFSMTPSNELLATDFSTLVLAISIFPVRVVSLSHNALPLIFNEPPFKVIFALIVEEPSAVV